MSVENTLKGSTHSGSAPSFKAYSPVGYKDYHIQSSTKISTSPQNCSIFFSLLLSLLRMHHAIYNRTINNYNYAAHN